MPGLVAHAGRDTPPVAVDAVLAIRLAVPGVRISIHWVEGLANTRVTTSRAVVPIGAGGRRAAAGG